MAGIKINGKKGGGSIPGKYMTTWLNDKGPISCHGILDGSMMIRDESCIVFLLVSLFGVIGLVQVTLGQ